MSRACLLNIEYIQVALKLFNLIYGRDTVNQLPNAGLGELILLKSPVGNPFSGLQSFEFIVFSSLSFNSCVLLPFYYDDFEFLSMNIFLFFNKYLNSILPKRSFHNKFSMDAIEDATKSFIC